MISAMQLAINPTTGSYSGDRIDHLGNAVWLRIMTPRGSWWADPTLGSLLPLMGREKALPNITGVAEGYAADALRPLLDSGRAASVTPVVTLVGNKLLLVVTVVDATGEQNRYDFSWVM